MTIIYIAGPISGLPDGNKPAFDHAQDMLTKAGHIVMSPHSLPFGMPESSYMDICLAMVRACERVVLLKGWENSLGVAAEQALAHKLGKTVGVIHFDHITDPADLVELAA
ncbi:DUF4406 domain-containing protein [Thalassospira lohafexi]|uniref:Nucleoside 2-deoxyribosyltransferase n=1 Tax=Thalassospira lohafexi TaxID=744227 RepID=A0A2N3L3R8_9PROT|nr:DUF4406 domain-containing protein [Thalassospira lohafexi]PKR57483.1 nucleoside 2-deoxyribosyltransferase [Thalassospira lohafexi]